MDRAEQQKNVIARHVKEFFGLWFDVPEAYSIEKDGAMYYAFFAPGGDSKKDVPQNWSGEVELRGLEPGKYHVEDYVNKKAFGVVPALYARLKVDFSDHLLLEATKQ